MKSYEELKDERDRLVEQLKTVIDQRNSALNGADDARRETKEAAARAQREASFVIAAVVAKAGGTVVLSERELIDSFGLTLEMVDSPSGGGRTYVSSHVASARPPGNLPCGLTYDQLAVACKNVGFDLDCGQCAGQFFTGSGMGGCEPTCTTTRAR